MGTTGFVAKHAVFACGELRELELCLDPATPGGEQWLDLRKGRFCAHVVV